MLAVSTVPPDPPPDDSGKQLAPTPPAPVRSSAGARPKNPDARLALGRVVRALRTRRGWSQERLAYACGYDRVYVSQLERGQRWPTVEAVWYVLHALGADWKEFGEAMQSEDALRAAPAPRHDHAR